MKPRLFDGEHWRGMRDNTREFPAAMKPRLFDGEHSTSATSKPNV